MDPQGWKLWTSAKACSSRCSWLRFSASQEQIPIELRHKHHVSSSTLHFLNASSSSATLLHIQNCRSPTNGAQEEELVEVFAFHLALVLCINSIVVLTLNAARAQECESARALLEAQWAYGTMGPPHIGPKSLILAPQDIPDISGYQLGFGCQCVNAYKWKSGYKSKDTLNSFCE